MTRQLENMCYIVLNISNNSAVSLTKAKGDPSRAAQATTIIRFLPDPDQVADQTIGISDSRLSAILPCSHGFLNCPQHLFQAIDNQTEFLQETM